MNNLMIFEGNTVEIFAWNGQILFNPYDVGKCLDIDDVTVRRHLQEFNQKQLIKLKNSDVQNMNFRKLNNAGENFLTERGLYKLILKSRKENAERFFDLVTNEVLPMVHKTNTYTIQNSSKETEDINTEVMQTLSIITKFLKINDISELIMAKKLCESYNVPTNFLPDYVQGGDRQTKSATELLKQIGSNISPVKFNQLLIKKGFLEERKRPSKSSKTGIKRYKALTEKGLKYGENLINSNNPKETQPYYYVDTFEELYKSLSM